ncbi:MAG TPA: adenylate/guanylate cyclase domain-containing protein [Aggregatilineaceae bacterium]|nr:adenylate/guanylate cyclase domain-containing protein [Aggregatilineaceae bacterium]
MTLEPIFRTRLSRFLPGDLLEQLPAPQSLATAIRRLNSLHQAISSFLPQYIADNERLHNEDEGGLRPGTFMFSDVSGFTALSEKLQREGGKEGAEIMTQIINDFFAKMLEILAKSNGQLLKFAGDALLTFFPATPMEDETPLAIRTGLRMQRAMRSDFQPIQYPALKEIFGEHNLQLSMSIGICKGKLFEAVVGNTMQRDHIIQGDLPGQAMRAEEMGERDDVIITGELQEKYGVQFETTPVGEGFYRVEDRFGDQLDDYEMVMPRRRRGQASALFDFEEKNLLDDLHRNLERVENVARFVAPEVVNNLAFRGDHIEPENRLATVIFMHFTGFADLLKQWGDEQVPLLTSILSRYYGLIQRVIASNGGSLARTDPYKQGVKMLITFGAPVAHPDDPERAVMTALEMNRQLALLNARLREELPDALKCETFVTQRIGITHGPVFAGEVGWRARREYTVMGDDVNLAARFMAKGEMGQILISKRIWERVSAHFETQALEPFQLKGKSKPVPAYVVTASTPSVWNRSATSDTPFVGRDLQKMALDYGLQQARGPRRRQAFALQGEIGVGKTRMAKQVADAAEKSGFEVAWANCQLRHSQDRSVWAAILFQLLQLEQGKSEEAQRRLLHVRLQEMELQELEGVFIQLLFAVASKPKQRATESAEETKPKRSTNIFELAQANSELNTSGLFGMARRQLETAETARTESSLWQRVEKQISLPEAIVRFVQDFSNDTPTLIVIDDAHQGDPQTLSILKRVLEEISKAKLVVIVAYEPIVPLDLPIRRAMNVTDLDQAEAFSLAANVLKVSEVDARLGMLLWERTKGRPLFVESLLRMLDENGYVVRKGRKADLQGDLTPSELPDDIRGLIISQIDRLSAEGRAVLRLASVLGDGFTLDGLLALGGEGEETVRLAFILDELVIAQMIEPVAEHTYRFRHGLTQAVVYESLNRLQRQKFHRTAADFLTQQQGDTDRNLIQIVYHLSKSGSPLRAMELIFDTAQKAEQAQRFDRAIELYTHAREIFPHDDSVRVQLERLQKP